MKKTNFRLNLFLETHWSRRSESFTIKYVFPCGEVELKKNEITGQTFVVNGNRLKPYYYGG